MENVLREMWQSLPLAKKQAYEDFARSIVNQAGQAVLNPQTNAMREKMELERREREDAKEAERRRIWERKDQERRQKEQEKVHKHRFDLFRKHMVSRRGPVEDLQLLAEAITNDERG